MKALSEVKYSTIIKTSLPTILSALSAGIMEMLDVLILAKYSTTAMNGASIASTWCNVFQLSTIALVLVTGSLVGQYNGAKKYKLASIPVWQMAWFSVFLFGISLPLSQIVAPYCIPKNLYEHGIPYLKIVMGLSPIFCIKVALMYFFISIGKGFIVFISSLLAVTVNTIIDIFLIFYCNYGTIGAAIGTVMGGFSELIFLFSLFFKKSIREKYGTSNCKLRIKRMFKYLKLGIFASCANVVESFIFSSISTILASSSANNALAQTIASNIWEFLVCLGSGLEKGVLSITANLLGANLKDKINILLKRGVNIHLLFIFIVFLLIFLFPDLIIMNFVDVKSINVDLHNYLVNVLKLVATCFIFDGIVWVEIGVLAAGGDVNYTMPTISICLLLFLAFPIFYIIDKSNITVETMWMFYTLADIACALVLLYRYKSNKWIKIKI